MKADADALVIGAGPAGAASAIRLAQAGWRVLLVEQSAFPRQKVCGECLTAGALAQLDDLGVGPAVRRLAGPELQRIVWSHGSTSVTAAMPPCTEGPYAFGRALGRDSLDALLAERAAALGVVRLQPARVRRVRGIPGDFLCEIELAAAPGTATAGDALLRRVPVVIDAHGSWETGPWERRGSALHPRRHGTDLFGFKASFRDARLAAGLLPVLAFAGGYGGMVVAGGGRLTLAGCIRRDTLSAWRSRLPGTPAGPAFEQYLRHASREVCEALHGAVRSGPWMTVGPLRHGIVVADADGPFRVGNAAAEIHPLIGEGINLALQSAHSLAGRLIEVSPRAFDAGASHRLHRDLASRRHRTVVRRLRVAALYARLASRPWLTAPVTALLRAHPPLLTTAARLAGKSRGPLDPHPPAEVPHEHA